MDLSRDEVFELIRCALNKIGMIRPSSAERANVAALLVAKGLMEADASDLTNTGHYPPISPLLRAGAAVWLSELGKAHILALKPEDFKTSQFWPLPGDIEYAQNRVRGG